ncbi:MAG: hypothetical protein ACI93N_000460 [Flavobacteriaceae bacterium]|jgi:hypothetical protein
MYIEKIIDQLNFIWNSSELIQAGINTEPIFDSAMNGIETSIDNIIIRTDSTINLLIKKNNHNINRNTDYFSFIALGIRYMSQFGAVDNSPTVMAKFGKTFEGLNWPKEYFFSKQDILIAFTRSIENSFNISLINSSYKTTINLN